MCDGEKNTMSLSVRRKPKINIIITMPTCMCLNDTFTITFSLEKETLAFFPSTLFPFSRASPTQQDISAARHQLFHVSQEGWHIATSSQHQPAPTRA